jgi:hypothetical protein
MYRYFLWEEEVEVEKGEVVEGGVEVYSFRIIVMY